MADHHVQALTDPRKEFFEDQEALSHAVALKLLHLLKAAAETEDMVHVALTGGGAGIRTLKAVAELLKAGDVPEPDWTSVHMWWGDERLLPADDEERNDRQARDALLNQLVGIHGLPEENIHPMPTSEDATNPEAGAQIYAQQLRALSPEGGINGLRIPSFTVMLLGVGPDGHINSLFPGKDSLHVSGRTTVSEVNSPKPPPLRVSLTFEAIHTAQRVWAVVAGEDKAEAVGRAFSDDFSFNEIPAKNALGVTETIWHIDRSAASQLPGR